MASPLENIPYDVLQYIAVLASSSSALDPPVETLHLMLTGPVFYEALNIRSAPHVCARIFAAKFDTAAPFRRYRSTITDSAQASELVNRCRLLQRSKRGDVSARNLLKDLSTALWMYLESDGLNERQLLNVGFPDFILSVAKTHLTSSRATYYDDHQPTISKVIVWLLCLALSRKFILEMSRQGRKELYALIFPYILLSETNTSSFSSCPMCQSPDRCRCIEKPNDSTPDRSMHFPTIDGGLRVPVYGLGYIPSPSFAAGNLASVIFESEPMKMPSHLLDTRVLPVQTIQPTKSDFKAFAAYETPLFADSLIGSDFAVGGTPRSTLHDLEFRHFMARTPLDASYPKVTYVLGSMTAVWEGVFRTIDAPAGSSAAEGLSIFSVFIKPIQCALREYVNDKHTSTKSHIEALSLSHISLNEDGSELYARGCTYRRHDGLMPLSDPPVHDAILLHGETLENHDHAWGGFKFWGFVDEDGKVTLKRSAKENAEDIGQGVWEFEGRLRFGNHDEDVVVKWERAGAGLP